MSKVDLANYRMEKAREILVESKDTLDQNHYGLSINRSYYVMFTAARALLALKGLDSSKHSGVIALFNQHIVKVGLFSKEFSRHLPKAKRIREEADYGDFVKITQEDAQIQLNNAQDFAEEAKKRLQEMIENVQKDTK